MTSQTTVVHPDCTVRLTPITTTAADDWRAAITLCGPFDLANAADLRRELVEHVDAGRRVIRVDVAAVEFMDSTAIGALVEASERCRADHGSLIVTNVSARMTRLFTITGLDTVLLIDNASHIDEIPTTQAESATG